MNAVRFASLCILVLISAARIWGREIPLLVYAEEVVLFGIAACVIVHWIVTGIGEPIHVAEEPRYVLSLKIVVSNDAVRVSGAIQNSPFKEVDGKFNAIALALAHHLWEEVALSETRLELKQSGQSKYDIVFGGLAPTLREKVETHVHPSSQAGMRIYFVATGGMHQQACWEALHPNDDASHLSLNPVYAFSRILPGTVKAKKRPELPLRMLLIVASPGDQPLLDVKKQRQIIKRALRATLGGRDIKFDILVNPTRDRIRKRVDTPVKRYDIIHFVGHGVDVTRPGGTQRRVALTKEQGGTDEVEWDVFADLLTQGGPRAPYLVFLCCCQSAAGDDKMPLGVANALLAKNVQKAIAMTAKITEKTSFILARKFYCALAMGRTPEFSLQLARRDVWETDGIPNRDVMAPILLSREDE